MWLAFARFESKTPQRKHLLRRKRYWLYYALTFIGGAQTDFYRFCSILAGGTLQERRCMVKFSREYNTESNNYQKVWQFLCFVKSYQIVHDMIVAHSS